MVGIRIGDDFKHMNKITSKSYTKALDMLQITKETKIYVISDVKTGWETMIDSKYLPNAVHVNEDDITQMYVGMMCDSFICSESTYHYMIALLAYITDQRKKVIIFNQTDLTKRKLSHILNDWIIIDY